MAVLAASAITINSVSKTGGASSRRRKQMDVTLVLTGQGGLTNNIPAALFGMVNFHSAYSARDSSSNAVHARPSFDKTLLVLSTGGSAAPADLTATVRLIIEGVE